MKKTPPFCQMCYSYAWLLRSILLALVVIASTTVSRADHYYNSGDVTFTLIDNKLEIRVLGIDFDGVNDELDDIVIYYLDPSTNEWIKIFYGNMSNGDSWYSSIPNISLVNNPHAVIANDKKYGYLDFYYSALGKIFPGNAIFKVDYAWDIDSNGGPSIGTFYYTKSISSPYWRRFDDYADITYDRNKNAITYKFLSAQLYGEGVAGLPEGNKVKLLNSYCNPHYSKADEYIIICEGNTTAESTYNFVYSNKFEILYPYSNWVRLNSPTIDPRLIIDPKIPVAGVENTYTATVTLNQLDQSIQGKNVNFTMLMFEGKGLKTKTIFIPVQEKPKNTTVTLSSCEDKCIVTWSQEDSLCVKEFNVLKSTSGNNYVKIGTVTAANDYVVPTAYDVITNYTYIDTDLSHGQEVSYKIQAVYTSNDIVDGDPTATITIDLNPTAPTNFNVSSLGDDGGIEITWEQNCNKVNEWVLIKNGSEIPITSTLIKPAIGQYNYSYTDESVALCETYQYSLKVKSGIYYNTTESVVITHSTDIKGSITKLEASKGYFAKEVRLNWACNKSSVINKYVIKRKVYASADNWTTVEEITDNKQTQWIDEYTQPGVLYNYRITGFGTCGVDAQGIDIEIATATSDSEMIEDIGFRQPVGTISGQVIYEGGQPVEGVEVALDMTNVNNEFSKSANIKDHQCIKIDFDDQATYSKDFTYECWVRVNDTNDNVPFFIWNQGQYAYENLHKLADGRIEVAALGMQTTKTDIIEVDDFFHYAVRYNYATNEWQTFINGETIHTANPTTRIVAWSFIKAGYDVAGTGNFNFDEIRIWKKLRTDEEIKENYSRYLTGEEEGLIGYYHIDEGAGNLVFDCSKSNGTYHNNHGELINGGTSVNDYWSNDIPSVDKLAFRGITSSTGNYLIKAIPYQSEGSLFNVVPTKSQHEFQPNSRAVFIGEGGQIQNNVDFTDVSSFEFNGLVKYNGSDLFPVESVNIAIDGVIQTDTIGNSIATNKAGQFKVEVPIGKHTITVQKEGHIFSRGSFTGSFYEQIDGIYEFIDSTYVKLAGRIVGGDTEGNKPLGFGLSINNVGTVSFTISPIKEQYFIEGSSKTKIITTNSETGEYEVFVYPEKYKIVGDIAEKLGSPFTKAEDKAVIDLASISAKTDTLILKSASKALIDINTELKKFTLKKSINDGYYLFSASIGDTVYVQLEDNALILGDNQVYIVINESTFFLTDDLGGGEFEFSDGTNTIYLNLKNSETLEKYTIHLSDNIEITQGDINIKLYDLYTYNGKRSWTLQNQPEIVVTSFSNQNQEMLSESRLTIGAETIDLFDDEGNYSFGKPVLIQGNSYHWMVKVLEKYTNVDDGKAYTYDIPNTILTIKNNCAKNTESEIDTIKIGYLSYSFKGGEPNLMENSTTPEDSYSKNIDISAKTPKGVSAQWTINDEPYSAYVLGEVLLGKNFYTEGPDLVEFILRDPPGSGSYATLEKGSTITTAVSYSSSTGTIEEDVDHFTIGLDYEWDTFVATIVLDATADDSDGEIDSKITETGTGVTISTTLNTEISTSSEAYFTGAYGDVFIGKSTNQFYGESQKITIFSNEYNSSYPKANSTSGFYIGKRDDDANGIELGTTFIYTHNHIENYLIPELERKRINYYNDHTTWYTLKITDSNDDRYLTCNDDPRFDFNKETADVFDGESYAFDSTFVVSAGEFLKADYDSLGYFSRQINKWKEKIALNEWEKFIAKKIDLSEDQNISFDAGSEYTVTKTISNDNSYFTLITIEDSDYNNKAIGSTICGVGYIRYDNWTNYGGSTYVNEIFKNSSKSISYHLADANQGDYYSVNVDKCIAGHGPVFTTLGGQSSCPYEPGYKIQYEEFLPVDRMNYFKDEYISDNETKVLVSNMFNEFKNEYSLAEDPLKIEDPVITCAKTEITDVRPDDAAVFDITVGNRTNNASDIMLVLRVEPSSNPYGAIVEVDGQTINNGMSIMLQGGKSMLKKVKIYKGVDEVDDYENIKLLLHTECAYDPTDDVEDASDEILLTARFTSTNSPIQLLKPSENWVVNKYNNGMLNFKVSGYDLRNVYFDKFVLQFKKSTQSDLEYQTIVTFFNNDKPLETWEGATVYNEYSSAKELINSQSSVVYDWDVADIPDGTYVLRAMTFGTKGTEEITQASEVLSGIIDTKSPSLYGTPQPADGILSVGENISIQFSEAINEGMLTGLNFAILNSNSIEIPYNYIVHTDKIILIPDIDAIQIEKTVLTIRVKEVEDLRGNKMISPVEWSVYVHQNPLSWMEDLVELEKWANDELQFNVKIQNAGGTFENYTIENLPAWLVATPQTGIIDPTQQQTIQFSISPGLNVGVYNEEINLHTGLGFDEKLNLSLRVKGNEPDWKVTPSAFGSSMSFVSQLSIGGQLSTDIYDKIYVFAGNECRGLANVQYYQSTGEYLVMLDVYGNVNGEALNYRIYDASTGMIFTSVTPNFSFMAEMVYGDFIEPVLFECGSITQNSIDVNMGWTWLSFNATLDQYASISELMSEVTAISGDRIIDDTNSEFKRFEDEEIGWQGSVNVPETGRLYRFYIQNGGTLEYDGSAINPEDYRLSINKGWNRIGYMPSINIEMNEALSAYPASVNDVIKGQLGFAMYNGYTWLGTLTYLKPGQGYMLKRNDDTSVEFSYPKEGSFTGKSGNVNVNELLCTQFEIDPYLYPLSGSVLATLANAQIDDESYLMAYLGGELRGVTKVSGGLQFITVLGNESDIGRNIYFDLQTKMGVTQLEGSSVFKGNEISGTFANPVLLNLSGQSSIEELMQQNSLLVYPNPMNTIAKLQFQLSKAATINFEISNAIGQVVYRHSPTNMNEGQHNLVWDSKDLPSGLYTIKATIGTSIRVIQFNKIR
ncbi:MAG: LamG-like jellyroll fold domain-containing protein [Prolixibacteraceae bacterium]